MNVKIVFMPAQVSEGKFEELETPPLAIYLKYAGHNATIIDPCEFLTYEYQNDLIEKCALYIIQQLNEINVLAFSSNTFNWGMTKAVVNIIGERYPNLPIVLGGLHPTIFDVHALRTTKASFVLRGEGEMSFAQLLEGITGAKHYDSVPGLTYKCGDQIYRTEDAKSLEKECLVKFPYPDYSLIPPKNTYNQIPVESSRGCAFSCSFCSIPHRHNWRGFEVDEVVNRVDYAVENVKTLKYNDHVLFVDDCFSINPDRACLILDRLQNKYDCDKKFFLEVRVSNIIRHNFLKPIYNNIIYGMQIGVECGYDEGLRKINKKITVKQLYEALDIIMENGFAKCCMLSFIIGFPWETEAEIKETLDTMEDIAMKYNVLCNLNWLIFLPSNLWEDKEKYGIEVNESIFDDPFWLNSMDNFRRTHPNISLETFDYVDRRYRLMQEMNLRVAYNRPYSRDKINAMMNRL
jgi:anaerobic magnesium-protoporphyrin IX monomethyl ester cyclase